MRNNGRKDMHFTHYVNHGNGNTTLCNVTHCENCGALIEAPNAVGGVSSDIHKYKKLGMKELPEQLAEGYYSDEIEGEACEHCNA